ncbi:DUF3105 domain-containing protein [Actinotalea sp. C106]|uniref:DUF3105 domain-containing protein n=1 Tax=Actinotalea sp. C106 TaxID=2908644 RepID=UPI0020293394|nr:DUF3105 domain-containing protein [Actinotalea sp. C106]
MSGPKRASAKDERRARLAEIQSEQRRAERRRTRIIVGVSAGVALALIIPAAIVIVDAQQRQSEVQALAEQPIDGVAEFEELTANHVAGPVDYTQTPPVGGDHDATWQNCGFYEAPVTDVHAVHSLEHGAVWITYSTDLPEDQIDTLRSLTEQHPYLLVSPYEGLDAPVVASAWGLQLELDTVDDDRLEPFLLRYLQGPQTLEPGAACQGGVGA